MIDPRRPQAGEDGMAFGYLGVNARLCIVFAGGTRYERLVVPWLRDLDWPRVAGEVGRFNAAALLATPPELLQLSRQLQGAVRRANAGAA